VSPIFRLAEPGCHFAELAHAVVVVLVGTHQVLDELTRLQLGFSDLDIEVQVLLGVQRTGNRSSFPPGDAPGPHLLAREPVDHEEHLVLVAWLRIAEVLDFDRAQVDARRLRGDGLTARSRQGSSPGRMQDSKTRRG
jgi:hypothetical protein